MSPARYVAVGRVGRPHGLRGEVRVDTRGALPRGLQGYTRFYLGRGDAIDAVEVNDHRVHGRFLLMHFAGCESPEAARRLTGSTLYVERSEMPALEEGEYYHADLLGCAVVDENDRRLGCVVDVFASGAHDVLVIESDGREWMLPVLSECVLSMAIDRNTIVVRLPEGLDG